MMFFAHCSPKIGQFYYEMQDIQQLLALKQPDLSNYIQELIDKDMPALLQLLYRLDIDEDKLKTYLANNSIWDAATIISTLIMDKLQYLKEIRAKNMGEQHIPETEKW
jgi:hypothetical protein